MTSGYPLDLTRRQPNIYGFSGLDRSAHLREEEGWLERLVGDEGTRLVPVWRSRSLVLGADSETPAAALLNAREFTVLVERSETVIFLGNRGSEAHVAVDLSHLEEDEAARLVSGAGEFLDLRQVGPVLERFEGSILAYARGLMHWHQRHRYCGVCGASTRISKGGHQRNCSNESCRTPAFPRTDPAVIMLVHDSAGENALLGRQAVWPEGRYSTLAGFVEPGETLEEAVAREVYEETGVEVRDVRYHSSQPWPFPASIMLGFHAEAKTTEIHRRDEELEDAQWFSREELLDFRSLGKALPSRDSIARRLIEDWLAGEA
ncbi:NAD(+) diphosphatase [Nisaea sp.]|uniref:NAD(+) diphosphatase n=1 Tax=Nisaea sp. TaxID=2024842 RepID=UPI003B521D83